MNESTVIEKEECVEDESEESVLLFMLTCAFFFTTVLLTMGFFAGFFYANWNQGEDRRGVAQEALISDVAAPVFP